MAVGDTDVGCHRMAVVVRPEVVNEAVAELIGGRIHEHFAGYLCMLRTATSAGTTRDLRPNFAEFFDTFLAVPNAPDGRPYLRPFNRAGSGPSSWNQANVAGSYAPSSIRAGMPFARVVEIQGQGNNALYSLRDGHAALALEHLAQGHPVPAVPLAAFLYRDFGFQVDGDPSAAHLVQIFRYEFGYQDDASTVSDAFRLLYADESDVGSTAEMFEEGPA